jgi:flagellar biosynthesis protein FlhG
VASGEWKLEQPWWERPPDPAALTQAVPRPVAPPPVRARQIIAVGGGKGGSGKSLVSVSLAVELARRGLHPLLVDCDLGGANLHTFFGLEPPRQALSDFVLRRVDDLSSLVLRTPVPGVGLLPGARNAVQIANPLYQQKQRLLRELRRLDAEVVILDLGAGSHTNVVDFFLLADTGILVVVPEPTSVENAYLFLKAAFLRRLKGLDLDDRGKETLQEAMRGISGRPRSPAEIVRAVGERDTELAAQIDRALSTFRPWLVVNQVRLPADLELGDGMCAVAERVFGITLSYLGHLRHYDQVWRAVRAHQPVFFEQLGRPFAADVVAVVNRLPGAPALAREVAP